MKPILKPEDFVVGDCYWIRHKLTLRIQMVACARVNGEVIIKTELSAECFVWDREWTLEKNEVIGPIPFPNNFDFMRSHSQVKLSEEQLQSKLCLEVILPGSGLACVLTAPSPEELESALATSKEIHQRVHPPKTEPNDSSEQDS